MLAPGADFFAVVLVEELWESVATMDQGYTGFFCSPTFLFLIPSQLTQRSIGGFAVFVRKEAAFFFSGFLAM